jgi:hypothetical protein
MVGKPLAPSWADSFGVYFQTGIGFDCTEGSDTAHQTYDGISAFLSPQVGQWYHLAMTYSEATGILEIYVFDPSTGDLTAVPSTGIGIAYDGSPVVIGADVDSSVFTAFFTGELDEVYIWNIVRSPSDLAIDRAKLTPPGTPGVVGYWSFDGNFNDSSNYGSEGVPSDPNIHFDPNPNVPF